MNSEGPFSPELWEQSPAAVQDYIRAPETRLAVLEAVVRRVEATVQHMTEQAQ